MGAILAYKDRLASTTITTAVDAGVTLNVPAAYPLSRLQTRPLKIRTKLEWANSIAAPRAFAVRMRTGSASGIIAAALVALEGANPGAGILVVRAQPMNGAANVGTPVDIDLSTAAAYSADLDALPHYLTFDFETLRAANGVDFTFTVAASSSGNLYIGRAFAGTGLRLADGVDAGWQEVSHDTTSVHWNPKGVSSSRSGAKYRRISASIGLAHEDLALGDPDIAHLGEERTLRDLFAYVGVGREVLLATRTSKAYYVQRNAVLGQFTREPELPHRRGPYFTTRVEIREGR